MTQPIGSDSLFRDAWIEGAAKAFFATAYADFVEEGHSTDNELTDDEREARLDLPRPGAGEDWMDYIPEVPPAAYALAGELWALIGSKSDVFGSKINGACGVYSLAERAEAADGEKPDPEQFGHYMAMQAMGHGVSWFDDHKGFTMVMPSIECSQCSFSDEAYGL